MFNFSKAHRLKTKTEIDFVFSKAKKLENRSFLLLYRGNTLSNARLGIIIAKKKVPKAHDRNRIKRIIRETFRNTCNLANVDIIFLARLGLAKIDNTTLSNDLKNELNKLKTTGGLC